MYEMIYGIPPPPLQVCFHVTVITFSCVQMELQTKGGEK